jgi:Txe/YoeB family toxin of Txe-Axe toxin-antitoxin module
MRQRALCLADADSERAPFGLACFDKKFAKEMRFSRSATSEHRLVPRRREQRLKRLRCRNFQNGQ